MPLMGMMMLMAVVMLTQNWIFNESFLQQLSDSASRPSDGRGWKGGGVEDQVSPMIVMMMVMVMMMISFLEKDKDKLTSYCPRSILVTQDPWVSRSSQTTTFPLFANINKCAFCQLGKCNNALGVILTPQITWIDVGNIYFVFSEQICLLFAEVPARAALTYISGTRSELLISKHIKRTELHCILTFCQNFCQFMTKISPFRATRAEVGRRGEKYNDSNRFFLNPFFS